MSKFVVRRNRIAAGLIALGALAVGGFATQAFATPDAAPAAMCRPTCF
jgi:hypothetical protein